MLFLTQMALLLLSGIKDAVSRKTAETPELIKARLGEPLTLDCTYNCSSGFIRGHWKWEDKPKCGSCLWEKKDIQGEDMCTVRLTTRNLTLEQTLYNYSCVSEKNDDQHLPLKTERLIALLIQDKTTAPVTPHTVPLDVSMKVVIYRNEENDPVEVMSSHSIKVPVGTQLELKCLSTVTQCGGQWTKDQGTLPKASAESLLQWDKITEEDGGSYTCYAQQLCTSQRITVSIEVIKEDEFVWIRVLAAITLSAAFMLLLLLIFLCYKRKRSLSDSEDSSAVIYENTRIKNEATVLKPVVQGDCFIHCLFSDVFL
ncbi:uncharacterized protein LOC118825923 [Colossoma macropomum]|uniref:uncharacterized protein LOC118825923 n=1 Tax=Colossoma macropomum TaxID=42526 RepID=UPI001864C37A|nr:uncharacterized protein LOC118825923 [Colossoma macropomum]